MANRLRPFVVDRNIRHFVWYGVVAGEGLKVGWGNVPIQEHLLYPAPHSPFTGRGILVGQPRPAPRCFSQPLGRGPSLWRPLRVARDLEWCDHDYPRWGGHTLCRGQIKAPVLGAPASIMGRSFLDYLAP